MPSFEEIQKARIANSFNTDEGLSELTKSEILDIEKGGKRAMIGEKRTFAGREYIKTSDGWKFHGKGTGSKAQEHVQSALNHHVDSDIAIRDHAKEIAEDAGMKVDEFEKLNSETKKELWRQYKKNNSEESHKDATDYFVEVNGKHYIDILDPDTGEKKFKPGDKVHYIDDNGKRHKGTISDREHPDRDMFEVDREDVSQAFKTIDGLYNDFDGDPSKSKVQDEIKKLKDSGLNNEQIKSEIDKQTKMSPREKLHFYDLLNSHKGEDSKEAHEKRGFKEESGDEDVTGKFEELDPKEITNKQFSSEEEKSKGEKAKHEFNKLQQNYNEKVNSLSLLKTDGWKESFSTNSTTKSYGEEKFIKQMVVRVDMALKTKDTYFAVDCGYAKSPNFGEEADKYYSELNSLKEKKFSTAREAAKAADKFAEDWNKEE